MDQIKPKRRRLIWWLAPPIFMAVLATIGAVAIKVGIHRAESRWQDFVLSLQTSGEPLTFADLSEHFEGEIEEGTVAELLDSISDDLEELHYGTVQEEFNQDVFVLGAKSSSIDFFNDIPEYAIAPSRSFLDENESLISELRTAAELPTGQFFNIGSVDDYLDDHYTKQQRMAAKVLHLDGMMALIEGDVKGSARNILAGLRLASTLKDAPSVILRLIQLAQTSIQIRGIECTLRVGSLDDPNLRSIADQLNARGKDGLRWAMLGERAYFVDICELLMAGQVPTDIARVYQLNPYLKLMPARLFIRLNQIRGTEIYSRLIEASDHPLSMIDLTVELQREIDALPKRMWLVKTPFPDLNRTAVLHARALAEIRGAQIMIASERFRLANGQFPSSVAELIPDFLPQHLVDPFDDQPMRFQQTDEGLIIYSIGEDRKDDGGLVTTIENEKRPRDWGFRLFKPELRGVKITDEQPPPGDAE